MPASTKDLALLPKAELHLHLEGAMRPSTLQELCAKYSLATPSIPSGDTPFDDFSAFVDVYVAACNCLRTAEDARRLVLEVAEDLKGCGVLYAEIAPSFTFYADNFGGMEDTLKVLVEAAELAERSTGVMLNYVVSIERHLGVEEGMKLAHLARKGAKMQINGRPAVVGFGLHGPEEGFPPGPYREAFAIACKDGALASLPHAGEIAPSPGHGAKSVLDAVQLLKAKRIAHGILARDDPEVLELLKENGVALDIGVTSNFLLNVVASRESHPIKDFLRRGIRCTINSDDPLLFGCNILSEYQMCRDVLEMDDALIAQCARTSFECSCAPEGLNRKGVEGVQEWLSKT